MGAYLTKPITEKVPEDGSGNQLQFGSCSMQGWRVSQEDAHNCEVSFDKDSSLFAVYDGHGGSDVAIYLSRYLPSLLKTMDTYKNGEWSKALHDVFLHIDESMRSEKVLLMLQEISKIGKPGCGSDAEEKDDISELCEEASMPMDQLLAKYHQSHLQSAFAKVENQNKPTSSKALMGGSDSSSSSLPAKSTAADRKIEFEPASSESLNLPSNSIPQGEGATSTKEETSESIGSNLPSNDIPEEVKHVESAAETQDSSDEKKELEVETTKQANNGEGDLKNSNAPAPTEEVTETEDQVEVQEPVVVVHQEAKENGNGITEECKMDTDHKTESESINGGLENGSEVSVHIPINSSPEKPRKTKVHPQAPPPPPEPVRVSPRKKAAEDEKLYKEYRNTLNGDASSGSEEEDDKDSNVAFDEVDNPDTDDSEQGFEENSSSSPEDDDDEDTEDDDEDDFEDEDEDHILNDLQEPGVDSGSTAVVAFMKWDDGKLNLWVANAGDSRCVVSRTGKAIDMSQDHKPEDEKETRRIVAAGGKVTADGRVNGGLNLSRAIGDHTYKKNPKLELEDQMITPVPDIRHEVLDPATDEFVVLACDGIWNSMSSQQVVDFVAERIKHETKLSNICQELFDKCIAKDTAGDGTGCDNMTAIIVRPQPYPPGMDVCDDEESEKELKRSSSEIDGPEEHSKRLKLSPSKD